MQLRMLLDWEREDDGQQIMVIRHAEKPDDAGTIFGVSVEENHDPEALIVRGWQRSGALATFFAPRTVTSEMSVSKRRMLSLPVELPNIVKAYARSTPLDPWPN